MHQRFDAQLTAFEARIGVTFENCDLLVEALTHRSYLNEHRDHRAKHNERLEFLGDAVLELAVTDHLFKKFPDEEEGHLTNLRAALVRSSTLEEIGRALELDAVLLLSRGEQRQPSDSKSRQYIRANAVEALIGAIYCDQGMGACRLFIDAHFLTRATALIEAADDPKSEIQQLSEARFGITPHYDVMSESGPDHDKRYRVALFIGATSVAIDDGRSKREAQCAAARQALETFTEWSTQLIAR
ncbi:MAG: ribonuclease III [Candidatus Uhrbacteria bacterium]